MILDNGEKTIGGCYAPTEAAAHLESKEHAALSVPKDIAYDVDGEPVYNGKEIINADRYEYKILTSNTIKKG